MEYKEMSPAFITLYELNTRVKQTLKNGFAETLWITAEITSVQENRSGHCYLELADKQEAGDKTIAVARATIWSFTYGALKTYFTSVTGRVLEKGMKILVNVEVVFHELYGFSLNIKNIDPTFTIGDLARKKREILEQLEKDGIIDMNRGLTLPLLPKSIAVISSPTAAGYGDFIKQLTNNSYGYTFYIHLFPAVMQGDTTTGSIISALEEIYRHEELFDIVVIIRGGGSQADLGSFDTYELSANVAQFPLPVIAGIGHDRDETIVDRVAYMSVKTPTAAAAFLIECFSRFDALLEQHRTKLIKGISRIIDNEYGKQERHLLNFTGQAKTILQHNGERLRTFLNKAAYLSERYIQNKRMVFLNIKSRMEGKNILLHAEERNRLAHLLAEIKRKTTEKMASNNYMLELTEAKIKYVDPIKVLERGYTISRINGKTIKSLNDVKAGEIVETEMSDGKFRSIVE